MLPEILLRLMVGAVIDVAFTWMPTVAPDTVLPVTVCASGLRNRIPYADAPVTVLFVIVAEPCMEASVLMPALLNGPVTVL